MNIIQLQDRLKGTPDQTLIGYVQNPTGEVPTYLALGELERRKSMREKYQAQAAPEQSVAEQVVQEAQPQMPQGLAMLANPPSMTPEQTMQGVASLPAENVGKNYAGGGIVAFAEGGLTKADLLGLTKEERDAYFQARDGVDKLDLLNMTKEERDAYYARKDPVVEDTTLNKIPSISDIDISKVVPGIDLNPFDNTPDPYRRDVVVPERMVEELPPPEPDPALVDLTKDQAVVEAVGEEKAEVAENAKEKIAEGKPLSAAEQDAWMSLAKAGFAMAAGSSPFALQNIGAAGMVGVEDLAARRKERAATDVASNAALVKANQVAIENKLDVDKQALDYVEGVMGKPSELDNDVRIAERQAAYQAKKLELLMDYGLISKQNAMAVLESMGNTTGNNAGYSARQIK